MAVLLYFLIIGVFISLFKHYQSI